MMMTKELVLVARMMMVMVRPGRLMRLPSGRRCFLPPLAAGY